MKLISNSILVLVALSICEGVFGSSSYDGNYQSNRHRGLKKGGKAAKNSKNSKGGKKPKNVGAVYIMSNAPENELLAFSQDIKSGALAFEGAVSTNGSGALLADTKQEDPLASQDSIIVAKDCVLSVNAGSNTIASFSIGSDGFTPTFVDIYPSNGVLPVSLTEYKGLVYVLNAGVDGNISGYNLNHKTCALSPIPGSTVTLKQSTGLGADDLPSFASSPAQVGFTPKGNLIVAIKSQNGGFPPEKGRGSINEYFVDQSTGIVDDTKFTQTFVTDGTIPFSFTFDKKGNLLLAEAFGDQDPLTPNTGALTSYGNIDISSPANFIDRENTGGTATCWVRYAEKTGCTFTTSNGGSISSLRVKDGDIELVTSFAAILDAPIDLDFSRDDKYIYALSTGEFSGGQPRIYAYKVNKKCGITEVQVISDGLPDIPTSVNGVVGLATY